jgi:hypothetical protein
VKNVLNSIKDGEHANYRDCALTKFLKPYLVDGSVSMIIHVDPSHFIDAKNAFEIAGSISEIERKSVKKSKDLCFNGVGSKQTAYTTKEVGVILLELDSFKLKVARLEDSNHSIIEKNALLQEAIDSYRTEVKFLNESKGRQLEMYQMKENEKISTAMEAYGEFQTEMKKEVSGLNAQIEQLNQEVS